MKSELEDGKKYSEFMRANEEYLRGKLGEKFPDDCIELLHDYLGKIHHGIQIKDLTFIEVNYEICQTIMEIYYEKMEERQKEVKDQLIKVTKELYANNKEMKGVLTELVSELE